MSECERTCHNIYSLNRLLCDLEIIDRYSSGWMSAGLAATSNVLCKALREVEDGV